MYYGLIMIAVVLFSSGFALNEAYQKRRGTSVRASMEFSFISSLAGLIVLLAVSGFRFAFTPFTLCIALLSTLSGFAFTFCTFQALKTINLSLYSLFSMLGGMVLPFVQGIVFYGEGLSIAKVVCFALICAALLLTVEKTGGKHGTLYYIGIFVLNGMAGVFSKIFTEAPFPKTDAAAFTFWMCLCSTVLSALILLLLPRREAIARPSPGSICLGSLSGITNRIGNFLLVVALAHVDASVQYPMVTGGVMIVSTLMCFFGKSKPTKKEVLSVAVAFAAMLALFLIPV